MNKHGKTIIFWFLILTTFVLISFRLEADLSIPADPPVKRTKTSRPCYMWYSKAGYGKECPLQLLRDSYVERFNNTPINFIWLGSVIQERHQDNLADWLKTGVPVVLWYIPEILSHPEQVQDLENRLPGLRVLNLSDAGLDSLYNGFSISRTLVELTRQAEIDKYLNLYAIASNLARVALLVKGPAAIHTALDFRGLDNSAFAKAEGMLYLDTDIYQREVDTYYLPQYREGIHINLGARGMPNMNNDALYAAGPDQEFFSDLLETMMAKLSVQLYQPEMLTRYPPTYNGAKFMEERMSPKMFSQSRLAFRKPPSIREGNWHK